MTVVVVVKCRYCAQQLDEYDHPGPFEFYVTEETCPRCGSTGGREIEVRVP